MKTKGCAQIAAEVTSKELSVAAAIGKWVGCLVSGKDEKK